MQCDELIWKTIAFQFCSFQVKTTTRNFCRNEYNLTGLCSKQSCPLANSNYATLKEEGGRLYLYVKTIERAHTPSRMWEKIRLPKNYMQALETIDKELEFWPEFIIHKCKQRLTKLTQYIIRVRHLSLKAKPKLMGIKKKVERRERRREAKAEAAARLDMAIEKELLDRLKSGVYGQLYKNLSAKKQVQTEEEEEIVNTQPNAFLKALDKIESDEDLDDERYEEELEEEDEELQREFVSDVSDFEEDVEELLGDGDSFVTDMSEQELTSDEDDMSEDSEEEDEDDLKKKLSAKRGKSNKKDNGKKKRRHVEVEYEHEMAGANKSLQSW